MEEVMEDMCKIEIDSNELDDGLLDTFKTEIKEEPEIDIKFDDLSYKKYPLKTEIEYNEDNVCLLQEKERHESFKHEDKLADENDELNTHDNTQLKQYTTKGIKYEDRITDENNELKNQVINNQLNQCTTNGRKVNTVEKYFACQICFKRYAGKNSLKRHVLRQHTREKSVTYETEQCTKNEHQVSLNIHSSKKHFTCEICSSQFVTNGNLRQHIMVVHTGEKSFRCEVCTKGFLFSSDLKRHLRIHSGEKPFGCEICTKQFTQSAHLKIHMMVHTGEKPFRCDICTKQFSRSAYLKIHMSRHTDENSFRCKICNKGFSCSSFLKAHLRIHTGVKLFGCKICTKQFAKSDHLKRHMLVHTGEKPFGCEICTKQFTQSTHLKVHMSRH